MYTTSEILIGLYEVELMPYPSGRSGNWTVQVRCMGRLIGKTRFFRTYYFAKRYRDKVQRRLDRMVEDIIKEA